MRTNSAMLGACVHSLAALDFLDCKCQVQTVSVEYQTVSVKHQSVSVKHQTDGIKYRLQV